MPLFSPRGLSGGCHSGRAPRATAPSNSQTEGASEGVCAAELAKDSFDEPGGGGAFALLAAWHAPMSMLQRRCSHSNVSVAEVVT